ncbi:MAG: hypothetical protein ACTIJ9_13185 [Aequorivita sp.]
MFHKKNLHQINDEGFKEGVYDIKTDLIALPFGARQEPPRCGSVGIEFVP